VPTCIYVWLKRLNSRLERPDIEFRRSRSVEMCALPTWMWKAGRKATWIERTRGLTQHVARRPPLPPHNARMRKVAMRKVSPALRTLLGRTPVRSPAAKCIALSQSLSKPVAGVDTSAVGAARSFSAHLRPLFAADAAGVTPTKTPTDVPPPPPPPPATPATPEPPKSTTHKASTLSDAFAKAMEGTDGQGLTLVHFSAQLERFSSDRGCA